MSVEKNRPPEGPGDPDRPTEHDDLGTTGEGDRWQEPPESTARRSLREERPLETDIRDKVTIEPAAKEIARHADRRALQGDGTHYVRGVRDEDLPYYVDGVLERLVPNVETKYAQGKAAYWDPDKQALVIENGDSGSVFTPRNGKDYFDDL
ncbi:hypothetical protein [Saccharothrix lopnurensis]|uniref:Uncharacterized protein n=1 Tax=Saccharothrix lopnurensis TaxID=1670621 RepID=A0ABW1P897_9PSEU